MVYFKVASRLLLAALSTIGISSSSLLSANEGVETSSGVVETNGDWAIALSGGGLRSSLFMIGALKALDQWELDVSRYERLTGKSLDDDVKIGIVTGRLGSPELIFNCVLGNSRRTWS